MEKDRVNVIIKQFNETIDKWINSLDDYTLEMLCRKPQPGSWSLAEVYAHITDNNEYYLEHMKNCLSNNDNSAKKMHENAKTMFANNDFPDIMIDGPCTHTVYEQPKNKNEFAEKLVTMKEEVNRIAATTDLSKSKGKTEHPGLRFFNAMEWLQFAEMHMRHHFRQKKRIDEKL
jgi:hypothetical protein